MNTISLSQALKQKNRLAGEVSRLREIVQRENSRRQANAPRADVRAVFDDMIARSRRLAAFKGGLAAANAGVCDLKAGIYGQLNLQAELRGLIAFIKTLNTKEGEHHEDVSARMFGGESAPVIYVAEITRDEVDRLVAAFEAEIHALQDEIDAFNASVRLPLAG